MSKESKPNKNKIRKEKKLNQRKKNVITQQRV